MTNEWCSRLWQGCGGYRERTAVSKSVFNSHGLVCGVGSRSWGEGWLHEKDQHLHQERGWEGRGGGCQAWSEQAAVPSWMSSLPNSEKHVCPFSSLAYPSLLYRPEQLMFPEGTDKPSVQKGLLQNDWLPSIMQHPDTACTSRVQRLKAEKAPPSYFKLCMTKDVVITFNDQLTMITCYPLDYWSVFWHFVQGFTGYFFQYVTDSPLDQRVGYAQY